MINQTQLMIIIFNTEVLKSNLCHYYNAYILVRGVITIIGHTATQVEFKNWVPFYLTYHKN